MKMKEKYVQKNNNFILNSSQLKISLFGVYKWRLLSH